MVTRISFLSIFAALIPQGFCGFGLIKDLIESVDKMVEPLPLAIQRKADWLLKPDANTKNVYLHKFIKDGKFRDAVKLIKAKIGVHVSNADGETPVFLAVRAGSADVVRELINQNVALNLYNASFCTPLDVAVDAGKEDVIDALLIGGADANWKAAEHPDKMSMSPLMRGVVTNQAGIVQKLLDKGANTEFSGTFTDSEYAFMTPLDAAVYKIEEDIVKLLLSHNANVRHMNKNGFVTLHYAIQAKPLPPRGAAQIEGEKTVTRVPNASLSDEKKAALGRIMDLIVEHGARPSDADVYNAIGTPLNRAVFEGDEVVFAIIVERIRKELNDGVNGLWMDILTYVNRHDRKPSDVAAKKNRESMLEVLKKLEADCAHLLKDI